MSLEEGWLKRKGFWKDCYSKLSKKEIKNITENIQRQRQIEEYIVREAKFYLTHTS